MRACVCHQCVGGVGVCVCHRCVLAREFVCVCMRARACVCTRARLRACVCACVRVRWAGKGRVLLGGTNASVTFNVCTFHLLMN